MATSLVAYLTDISIRSFALAVIAAAALCARNNRSAAVRHAVWTMVVCGMLSLLALEAGLPRLPLRVLGATPEPSHALSKETPAPAGAVTLPLRIPIPDRSRTAMVRPSVGWREAAGWVYIAVTLAFLVRLMTAVWLVRRLLATSRIVEDPKIPMLRESASTAVPLTVGWIRPTILLPAGWREWDAAKLEAALAHEGAHVRRRDSLVALVAGFNKCLLWFHPLAWWLERRLAFLAEQACDDACLCVLKDRKTYARVLLEMAGTVRANEGRVCGQAPAMATKASHIRQRIDSILDDTRAISQGLTGTGWGGLLLSGASVIYCAGAVQLEHQRGPATPPSVDRPVLLAQQQAPAPLPTNRSPAPRRDTTRVSIPIEVRDPLNRFVTGLDKDNFKLFEDDVEQEISHVSNTGAPIAVAFVFDGRLEPSWQAVEQFLKTAEPKDEVFLVLLDADPKTLVELFRTLPQMRKLTFTGANSNGKTALLDGIYVALHHLKTATNPRKALLVISDGVENDSQYTKSAIVDLARETHAQVHAIGIGDSLDSTSLLSQLTEETAGHRFINDVAEAPNVAARIGIAVRNQYVLGYFPNNPARDGKYRSVKVQLAQPRGLPPLTVTSRSGYYAPAR